MKLLIVLALLIGFGLGLGYGYQRWGSHHDIQMMLGVTDKMIPFVRSGDTLRFPVPVNFNPGVQLCDKGNSGVTTCTVRQGIYPKLRYYSYKCQNPDDCPDPDVGGGSDIPIRTASSLTLAQKDKYLVQVVCQGGTSAVMKPPQNSVKQGQTIIWYPSGSIQSPWNVNGDDLKKYCDGATGQYDDSNYTTGCKVNMAGSMTYTVHVDGCKDVPDTIAVNP